MNKILKIVLTFKKAGSKYTENFKLNPMCIYIYVHKRFYITNFELLLITLCFLNSIYLKIAQNNFKRTFNHFRPLPLIYTNVLLGRVGKL